MHRILKIGLDVHSTNYTICIKEVHWKQDDKIWLNEKIDADYLEIVKLVKKVTEKIGGNNDDFDIECGYEAGCLGYTLYHDLTNAGLKCTILAPTTMLVQKGVRIKTDKRDARLIADCLASGGYHPVYVPSEDDEDVKEFIRMRDDHKALLKGMKQRIKAFCLRHNKQYQGNSNWTKAYIECLWKLELSRLERETLNEYLQTLSELMAKIEKFDKRIHELSQQKAYATAVKKLACFLGIKTVTALALIVEIGDYDRFAKAEQFASFLGLVPGERSSNESIARLGITKAGNTHLRRLLIEAAQSMSRGKIGYKSAELRRRQEGNTPEVVAYADKANVRLRSKYYRLLAKGKARNTIVAAVARELACFVWGMMTDHIALSAQCPAHA